MDADSRLHPVMAQRAVGQLQLELPPAHGVVTLDHAFLLHAQRLDQGRPVGRRHEGALRHRRRPGEAAVMSRQINLAQPAIGGLDVADAGLRQLLDQTILERAEQALRAIGWEGRFLVVGFTAGIPSIPLNLVLLKSCQIVGVFYGAMTAREPARNAKISDQLIEWVASGKLRPYVSNEYPLERAGEALRAMMDRAVVGKVVITP